jgi:hypothetical protein
MYIEYYFLNTWTANAHKLSNYFRAVALKAIPTIWQSSAMRKLDSDIGRSLPSTLPPASQFFHSLSLSLSLSLPLFLTLARCKDRMHSWAFKSSGSTIACTIFFSWLLASARTKQRGFA